jgi:hypothetical protein
LKESSLPRGFFGCRPSCESRVGYAWNERDSGEDPERIPKGAKCHGDLQGGGFVESCPAASARKISWHVSRPTRRIFCLYSAPAYLLVSVHEKISLCAVQLMSGLTAQKRGSKKW